MNELDEFLRRNKPSVKEDPTFLLETRRRLEAVEGIKAELDRQRSRGRLALVIALSAGLALGVFLTAFAILYPVDAGTAGGESWNTLLLFLTGKKYLLFFLAALLAIALGLVLPRSTSGLKTR